MLALTTLTRTTTTREEGERGDTHPVNITRYGIGVPLYEMLYVSEYPRRMGLQG